MANLKKQIYEEVSKVLMSFDDDKEVDRWMEENNITEVSSSDEEAYGPKGNPFDKEAVLVWSDGDNKDSSIELIPENMEHMKKYFFEYHGQKMFVQKKSIGTDKFEIGIFQDESE